MSYNLEFEKKEHYLHVTVTGQNSQETVFRYLQGIQEKCQREDCPLVLIEERLTGPRQDLAAVFQLVSEASEYTDWRFEAIAYVDVNAAGESMHFAETVAVNRSVPVRVFDTVPEAENWLLKSW